MSEKLKTQIKSATYYYVESNDEDLREYECGHHSTWEDAVSTIVRNKMYGSERFRYVDWDNEEEYHYFTKVENRFLRLLKYYLDPNKTNNVHNV